MGRAKRSLPGPEETPKPDPSTKVFQHLDDPNGLVFNHHDFYEIAKQAQSRLFPRGVMCVGGQWYGADDQNIWKVIEIEELEKKIYEFAGSHYWRTPSDKTIPIAMDQRSCKDIIHALRSITNRPGIAPFNGVPLVDGAYDLETGKVSPFELGQFVSWTLPFSSIEIKRAKAPKLWLDFLAAGFTPKDIDLLQEWFGYCLTGDTSLQRSLWIYGLPGCGKSVICEILCEVVGLANVCARKEESFRSSFNEDLLDKKLIYFADYRHDPQASKAALNFILTVAGGDPILVERKYKPSITQKLLAKIVFNSNNMPSFLDMTGATLRRLLVLHRQWFKGTPDRGMLAKLLPELPGIFAWAVEGAKRLARRGDFDASMLDQKLMKYSARSLNATYAFVDDRCHFAPGAEIGKQEIFDAWRSYAQENGHHQRFNREMFVASLIQTAAQFGEMIKGDGPNLRGITVRGF